MGWLKDFFRKHIVEDLPGEMTRCGYCNNLKCSNGHFDTCPNRLKTIQPDAEDGES